MEKKSNNFINICRKEKLKKLIDSNVTLLDILDVRKYPENYKAEEVASILNNGGLTNGN